ncbi:MAG: ribonuclease III [Actinomycetota bacterium]|nr:ribonuclease III [Actinomycetota bacterium]
MRPPGVAALAERLEPYLSDASLLRVALTHRSYVAESGVTESNERLEFLGDAVLGLVVASRLYEELPGVPEGDLARIRAAVVSEPALAAAARRTGIGGAVLLGRGEDQSGGRDKASILADAFEAIVGATYLAGGLVAAVSLLDDLLGEEIAAASAASELGDAKNRLQERCARDGADPPAYSVRESGPDHERHFRAEVVVRDGSGVRATGRGEGRSKKQAEREAALDALALLAASEQGRRA